MGISDAQIPKTLPCHCGRKPKREIWSLSYGSSNDVWRLICKCKHVPTYDEDFKNCYTEKEAVIRWNKLVEPPKETLIAKELSNTKQGGE